jgi:hypothetical protein
VHYFAIGYRKADYALVTVYPYSPKPDSSALVPRAFNGTIKRFTSSARTTKSENRRNSRCSVFHTFTNLGPKRSVGSLGPI